MEELVGKNFLLQTTGKDFTGSDRTESFEFSSTEIQGREYNKNVTFEPDTFIEFLGFFLGDGYVGINYLNKGNLPNTCFPKSKAMQTRRLLIRFE